MSGIAGAFTGLIGNVLNFMSQQNTNDMNAAINEKNLDWTKYATQQQWERDDNAHQREVEDLRKAGLSPLASTSGAMNSQALSSPSPIAMQAPQLDMNALVQSVIGSEQIAETKRHNKATEEYNSGKLENETRELQLRADSLDIENKKVEETIKQNAKIIQLQNDELDEKIRATKKNEELKLSELEQRQLEEESKRMYQEIARQAGGEDVNYVAIHDYQIYINRQKLWSLQFSKFIETLQDTRKSSGSNTSASGGISAGANVLGTGGNGSINGSGSHGEYSSSDISQKQAAMLKHFYATHPVPVYINKNDYPTYFRNK